MNGAVPIKQAASVLGVAPATVWRWIGLGCPVARRGRRGRGGGALLIPGDVEAWRRARAGSGAADVLRAFAGQIPELVADGVVAAFRDAEGPHKRQLAGSQVACWYSVCCAITDRLRADGIEVSDPSSLPAGIEQLRQVAEMTHEMSD